MLNIERLRAGRIYAFNFCKIVETVKYRKDSGTRVYAPDWLQVSLITVSKRCMGRCACPESYARAMVKIDPAWEPTGKPPWFEWTNRNGVVHHPETGKAYLALIHPRTVTETYFVNGKQATEEQTAEIREWLKNKKDERPVIACYNLDENVQFVGEIPASEADFEE